MAQKAYAWLVQTAETGTTYVALAQHLYGVADFAALAATTQIIYRLRQRGLGVTVTSPGRGKLAVITLQE